MTDNFRSSFGGSRGNSALRSSRSPNRNQERTNLGSSAGTAGMPNHTTIRASQAGAALTGAGAGLGRIPPRSGAKMSPLRSQVAARTGSGGHFSQERTSAPKIEEEMYERRRQQELRRQIAEKEAELQTMSNNNERLRNRLDQSSNPKENTFDLREPSGYKRASPLRNSSLNNHNPNQHQQRADSSGANMFSSGGGLQQPANRGSSAHFNQPAAEDRDRTPPTRLAQVVTTNANRNSNGNGGGSSRGSPLRQKSGSPTRGTAAAGGGDTSVRDRYADHNNRRSARGISAGPGNAANSSEYLNQLYADNASLQRRLNLVLQELDRVNRDKSNLVQQLSASESEVQGLQRMLDTEDGADRANGELQSDLNGNRDQNVLAKKRIDEVDGKRTDTIQRLRVVQGDRERQQHTLDILKEDLERKISLSKQLEADQFYSQSQITRLAEEIEILRRQAASDDNNIADINQIIDRLSQERNELMTKLEHLNRTYDNCVLEISRERSQMDAHNTHHNKLLVAKMSFNILEGMFRARKQEALNEFFTYCRFDERCHGTLKTFVGVMEKLGHYKMKIALKQWYQKCFKPTEAKVQLDQLCEQRNRQRILTRQINAWKAQTNDAETKYANKTKALANIWHLKSQDCHKDVQRAFTIWRDALNFDKFRRQRIQKLIWRAYSNRLSRAFQAWLDQSNAMNSEMRMHILAHQFTQQQLMRSVLANMKIVTDDLRRRRHQTLKTYLKAWREHNEYKKFMVHSNGVLQTYRHSCNEWLLKRCWDALRQNKETEKHLLMREALENDCQPAIDNLNKNIGEKSDQADRSAQKRALTVVMNMQNARIASYFHKWIGVQTRKSVQINKNLRAFLVRLYFSRAKEAFDTWKNNKQTTEICEQAGTVIELKEEGSMIQQANDCLSKDITKHRQMVDRSARSSLNRAAKICRLRFLKQGIDRWAATKNHQSRAEDKADFIINKVKKRFLRKAFNLYLEGCQNLRKIDQQESSATQMRLKVRELKVRTVFRAIKGFTEKQRNAERYLGIVFKKMDVWESKSTLRLWRDNVNAKIVNSMVDDQNTLTEEMGSMNNQIGQLSKVCEERGDMNRQMDRSLRKQGERALSNTFVRMFYTSSGRAFERWKEYVRHEKHRDVVVRRTLEHWKRNNSQLIMSGFKNWRDRMRIVQQKERSAGLTKTMDELTQTHEGRKVDHANEEADLDSQIAKTNHQFDKMSIRRSKLVATLTSRNEVNHFQSRLRHMFLTWRSYTKRARYLGMQLKNALTKSMWQKGFDNIRHFSRDKQHTRDQNQALHKIRRRFWRIQCRDAFSKWRATERIQALEMIQITEEQTAVQLEDHLTLKRRTQKRCVDRSERDTFCMQKHKWFNAWKNVAKWLKHRRVSNKALEESKNSYAVKRMIIRWKARAETTRKARNAYDKFAQKRAIIYKRAVFDSLLCKFTNEKALIVKCGNIATHFDNRMKLAAFQTIFNFYRAKEQVYAHEKKVSTKNMNASLLKIYRKRMLQYLSHLRKQTHDDKIQETKKVTMFGHLISKGVRQAFMRWKKQAENVTTVIEVNEAGPVVEEVLDYQMDVANLKNLMEDEAFTKDQIENIAEKASKKGLELLAKSVARWKHYEPANPESDLYLIPKMFDRWRHFVAVRKIVKHWLNYIGNRQQHVKCDMASAFNKWKFCHSDEQNELQKKTRKQLMRRSVMAAKRLEQLSDQTLNDEDMVNHLSDQNDELFSNYQKGQKLAFVLGRDNLMLAQMKALARFKDQVHKGKGSGLQGQLGDQIGAIAALKDKISEVENDNEALANENEELRQFSLDGYQLGKNVQNLTQEREKLSVDLADKAATIKKLLDENERLSLRLRQVQDQAANLVQQSSQNINAMQRV